MGLYVHNRTQTGAETRFGVRGSMMRFPPCREGAGQEGELSARPPGGDAAPRAGAALPPLAVPPGSTAMPPGMAPGMAPLVSVRPLRTGTLFPECPQSSVGLLLLPSKTFRFEAVLLLTYLAAGKIRPACLSHPPQQEKIEKKYLINNIKEA